MYEGQLLVGGTPSNHLEATVDKVVDDTRVRVAIQGPTVKGTVTFTGEMVDLTRDDDAGRWVSADGYYDFA